jgi:hypothetical protein
MTHKYSATMDEITQFSRIHKAVCWKWVVVGIFLAGVLMLLALAAVDFPERL